MRRTKANYLTFSDPKVCVLPKPEIIMDNRETVSRISKGAGVLVSGVK